MKQYLMLKYNNAEPSQWLQNIFDTGYSLVFFGLIFV